MGESVAIFGLGAVGLACVQAAKIAGASKIIGIDMNVGPSPAGVDRRLIATVSASAAIVGEDTLNRSGALGYTWATQS